MIANDLLRSDTHGPSLFVQAVKTQKVHFLGEIELGILEKPFTPNVAMQTNSVSRRFDTPEHRKKEILLQECTVLCRIDDTRLQQEKEESSHCESSKYLNQTTSICNVPLGAWMVNIKQGRHSLCKFIK